MDPTRITVPGAEEMAQQAQVMLAQANVCQVKTPDQYQMVGQELVRIKALITQGHDLLDPICQSTDRAHKQATALRAKVIGPLETAEKVYKKGLGDYDLEQKRIAEAEEARLLREAQEEAAAKRAKLEARAEKAIEKGQDEKAESFLDQAAAVIPLAPVVPPRTVQVAGLRKTQFIRKARVIDPVKVPAYFGGVELRTINQSALNQLAKLSPNQPSQIPGVEFYDEPQIAAATGR